MRKYSFLILFSVYSFCAFAQDTEKHKNEFGVDATPFFKQFLSFNQANVNYVPDYYLTYRRYCKHGNFRAAIGVGFSSYNLPGLGPEDSNKYYYTSINVIARIGWEFTAALGKHWQAYYGADIITNIGYNRNDAQYWNGGYADGIKTVDQSYGIAPVMGIRYYITKRLSLLTEVSYSINYGQIKTTKYYIPVSSTYPTMPDYTTSQTKVSGSFYSPISLFIAFSL